MIVSASVVCCFRVSAFHDTLCPEVPCTLFWHFLFVFYIGRTLDCSFVAAAAGSLPSTLPPRPQSLRLASRNRTIFWRASCTLPPPSITYTLSSAPSAPRPLWVCLPPAHFYMLARRFDHLTPHLHASRSNTLVLSLAFLPSFVVLSCIPPL